MLTRTELKAILRQEYQGLNDKQYERFFSNISDEELSRKCHLIVLSPGHFSISFNKTDIS